MSAAEFDITGWSEERVQMWEREHEQFVTDARADAAADANEPSAATLTESERWRAYYDADKDKFCSCKYEPSPACCPEHGFLGKEDS